MLNLKYKSWVDSNILLQSVVRRAVQFSAVGGYKNGCQLLAKWLLPPSKNDDDLKQEAKSLVAQ